jgi:hypothetical protein
MKNEIQIIFTNRNIIISRFSILILCLVLSINLSGQNIQTLLGQKWTSGNWVDDSKQTSTYDVNGHLTNSLSQTWNGLSWETKGQINYTINPDGTTNQMVMQLWDGSLWTDFLRSTYTYNSSKQILTTVSEMLILSSTTKQTNIYDGSGYLTNTLSQTLNGLSWDDNTRSTYTNNSDGNPTLQIVQSWDGSQWNNLQQSTSTYNPAKKILTEVTDDWTIGIWVPHFKESYLYDGSGYLTNNLSQLWDAGLPGWKNDTQSNFANNPDGTAHQITNQEWTGVWNNTDRFTITYSSPTGSADLRNEENFTIYPNPASDNITIKANISIFGSTYSFTDQTGKLILTGKLTDETTVLDISRLANGIYFLQLGEKSQHSFKVIKK